MTKKFLLITLQSLFGFVLLFLFLETNDLSKISLSFKNVSLPLTLLIGSVYILAAFLRIWRFQILISPLKKISFMNSATTSLAGTLLNYLIPLRAGEVGRAWFIKKKYGFSLVSGTTVSFVDKIFDFLAVIVLVALIVTIVGNYSIFSLISYLQVIILLFILVFIYMLAFKEKTCLYVLSIFFSFLPKILFDRVTSIFLKFTHGFSTIKIKPKYFFFLIFLSLLSLFIDGIYFYLLFLLLGFKVSLPIIVLGYTLFNFSFILPGGPGYVGNIEYLGVLIFSTFLGVAKDSVVSVIVFHHILLTLILVVPGFISLAILSLDIRLSPKIAKGLNN